MNFISPYSLVYQNIFGVEKVSLFWCETFYRTTGERNFWSYIADVTSLIILIYFADASIRL